VKSLNRQQLTIGGLVLLGVVVALAGYLLAISPQSSKAQSLDGQIAEKQQQYLTLHEVRLGRNESLHAAELFQLSRAMPDTDDQPGIMLELSRLATASSMKLMAVGIQPRVALTDGSSAVPLNVSIDGSWTNLARFLRAMRNEVQVRGKSLAIGGRLFTIDQIAITPSANTNGSIEAQLRMNAFDYGAPPSPSATAGVTANTTTSTTTTTSSGSQQAAGAPGSSS
jgi:Tfp pilus assembly protein PilO